MRNRIKSDKLIKLINRFLIFFYPKGKNLMSNYKSAKTLLALSTLLSISTSNILGMGCQRWCYHRSCSPKYLPRIEALAPLPSIETLAPVTLQVPAASIMEERFKKDGLSNFFQQSQLPNLAGQEFTPDALCRTINLEKNDYVASRPALLPVTAAMMYMKRRQISHAVSEGLNCDGKEPTITLPDVSTLNYQLEKAGMSALDSPSIALQELANKELPPSTICEKINLAIGPRPDLRENDLQYIRDNYAAAIAEGLKCPDTTREPERMTVNIGSTKVTMTAKPGQTVKETCEEILAKKYGLPKLKIHRDGKLLHPCEMLAIADLRETRKKLTDLGIMENR